MSTRLLGFLACAIASQSGEENSFCDGTCPDAEQAASLLQRQQQRGKQMQPESPMSATQAGPAMEHLANVPDAVIAKMVLPGPYPCSLAWGPEDPKFHYCGTASGTCINLCGRYKQPFNLLSDGLHPANLSNISKWEDSIRLLSPIGSLPCCSTPPHCTAPSCKEASPLPPTPVTCTQALPKDNFAYITDEKNTHAYSSGGGSLRLDVYKHWDILGHLLGCYDNSTGQCKNGEPFDLAVDLGSDWGSVTSRLSARRMAKDYILLDAWVENKKSFMAKAFGNQTFNDVWFSEQVSWPLGKPYPHFEFLNFALSNKTEGSFDICAGPGRWHLKGQGMEIEPCPVPIVSLDTLLPGKLTPMMQGKFAQAQSLYLKMDLDGMDQLTIDGGRKLLSEVRGVYPSGKPRHLVNFLMLEFCPSCLEETRLQKGFTEYDLGTNVRLLESLGFETFLIGPRYVPLSGASWLDAYKTLIPGGTADLFALRTSHPYSAQIKFALGACAESKDFNIMDGQYVVP